MSNQKKPLNPKELPQTLCRRLVVLRYTLPLFSILVFLISGFFHSVFALQGKIGLWVSPIQLCFNTIKSARAYFLAGGTGEGSLYGLFLAGGIIAILCFLSALAFSIFSFSQLYVVMTTTDPDAARRAKIRHKTVFPSRVCLFLSHLLLLAPALFPEYVSLISRRYLGGGAMSFSVKCNIPLILLALILIATFILARLLAPQEKSCSLDLFDTKEDAKNDANPPAEEI